MRTHLEFTRRACAERTYGKSFEQGNKFVSDRKKASTMISEKVDRDLKYVYSWNYYTMRFLGIWPEDRRWNHLSTYIVIVPVTMMLFFVCIPQIVELPLIWGDLHLVVENLALANVTVSITVVKTITFWIHGTSLKSLLARMAEDWSVEMKPSDREVMKDVGKLSRSVIIMTTIMCNTVVILYALIRQIAMRYTEGRYFFRGYFPYDSTVSPLFELTFIAQLVTATFAASCYTSVDTFVVMLLLHVCGQLLILQNNLRKYHTFSQEELQKELGKFVERHEYVNKFAERIEKSFNVMLLLQMLACTMQLCFQCFQAIMSLGEVEGERLIFEIGFLIFYVVYVMIQLFLYCYVGERLLVQSTDIAEAAYECEWYNLSPKNAQLLVIIIQRARLPLQITAGRFCTFTLVLYSQILKTSMGYISVLYATKDK